MNALDRSNAPTAPLQSGVARPRIYYLDPLRLEQPGSLAAALGEAARMGFDTVLVPPPWAPGPDGDRFAPVSLDRVHPVLGGGPARTYLRDFVAACRSHRLAPMIDVDLGRVAEAFEGDAPFEPPAPPNVLDPRLGGLARHRHARGDAALGAWWGRTIAGWANDGIAGVRLLGLDRVDIAATLPSLRTAAGRAVLIAWTPGLSPAATAALTGVDYVVSSLPWWDLRGDWLWQEMDRLQRIAPVLACPEAPFGKRAAASVQDPALIAATLRRGAALACALGDGWLVPAGFESGARRSMDPRGHAPATGDRQVDLTRDMIALNGLAAQACWPVGGGTQLLSGVGAPVLTVLRTDATDARFAMTATLVALNTDVERQRDLGLSRVLSQLDGRFAAFTSVEGGPPLALGTAITLNPGEIRVFSAAVASPPVVTGPLDIDLARRVANSARVAIEAPSPCVEDGTLAAKRLVGDVVPVEADVVGDGHDKLGVAMRWRGPGETAWQETRMRLVDNDRYRAEMPLPAIGRYEYTVQAWRDAFASFRDELAKKHAAGVSTVLELREGLALLAQAAERADGKIRAGLRDAVRTLTDADDATRLTAFLSPDLAALMATADDRPRAATLPHPVRVEAERSAAAFAAWYEIFPRSMSDDPHRHGTFADVERHLPRVQAMGFDVLYFPPISPIGRINRKGRNNTLTPAADDPGSPYAIGSAEGGHDAVHPELGTLEDFRRLIAAAARHGLEIAIDFAIQCSPDHPWLREHRDWFAWRPDGTIKYAENPPKKYEDIVNVDFYASGAVPDLWVALANVVLFWCEQGVRLFRVDNPHTKPFPFWQWMIAEVRARYPEAIFLAEAFTRPKVMYRLAKIGFSQSYTYFTWRETKREMEDYVTELCAPGPREFFRPHFFVNTPDINPVPLQDGRRPGYLIRAALAATLSGLWGLYNGFELCEGTPVPGREEYLDSEKYQIRAWDWDRPGNIVPEITMLNRIRHLNPALRTHLNTIFLPAANDAVTVFEKATPDRSNVLVVAISFDPNQPQETGFEFPFWHWQVTETTAFEVENLLTGERMTWRGKAQGVRLTPEQPYAIWRVRAAT